VFIGIDYHKAYSLYSVLDLRGDSLNTLTQAVRRGMFK
jgi:hypothetical protein